MNREIMKPDDEFQPVLLMIDRNDREGVVGIDEMFMAGDVFKDALVEQVLPPVMREFGAVAVAFISAAWQSIYATNLDADIPSPSEDPNRIEIVMFVAVTATRARAFFASIERHP